MKASAANAVSDERMRRRRQAEESRREPAVSYVSTLQSEFGNSLLASQEPEYFGAMSPDAMQSTVGNAASAGLFEMYPPPAREFGAKPEDEVGGAGQLKEPEDEVAEAKQLKEPEREDAIAKSPTDKTRDVERKRTADEKRSKEAEDVESSEIAEERKADQAVAEKTKKESVEPKKKKAARLEAGSEPEGGGAIAKTKEGVSEVSAKPTEVKIDSSSFEGVLQSLATTPPSAAADALTQANEATPAIQSKEKAELAETFPEVERPSGLPRATAPRPTAKELEKGAAPDPTQESGREGAPPDVKPPDPKGPVPGQNLKTEVSEPSDEESDGWSWWDRIFKQILRFTQSMPTTDSGVSTSAGPREKVDLTGEANPKQNAENQESSNQEVATKQGVANAAVGQDFGENQIYPDVPVETLRSSYKPGAPEGGAGAPLPAGESGLNAGERAMFDQSTGTWYSGKIAEQQERDRLEREDYQAKSAETRAEGDRRMAEETERARTEQEGMQAAARTDVDAERGRWREENQKIKDEYAKQSEEKRVEADEQIKLKTAEEEKKADATLTKAEDDAKEAKRKKEAEAAEAKRKEEQKPRSWWQRVKGAISSVLNAIKKAVNAIFDALRSIVKGIFELAKKVVRGIIEAARILVVGLIKAFGAVLKGLVTIALAAFPETAKKARAWIDKRVDSAVTAVNSVAEKLKKATDAILDFVASTLDSFLGLVQKLQNAILTVVGMLITGEIFELIKRIGYLISAARTVPDQFETAALEELLGGNLDEPLSPEELAQAGVTPPGAANGQESGPSAHEASPSSEDLPKPPWGEHNVGVDEVDHNMELSPELAADLVEQTGGDGATEIGSSADESRSMQAVMSEVSPTPIATNESGKDSEGAKYPDDGLTPTRRAEIKWQAMKDGISKWWSENWPTVLAAAAAALLGFIALNIVTGGAVAAALPAILAIIGPLFAGLTILKLAEHVADYVEKGWEGQIQPAGKSLSKALAAGAIELISYLTFKAAGAALKGARALAKGGLKLAAGGLKLAKAGASAVVRGAKFVISKGKVLFRGIAKGLGKMAKKAKDLGAKLLERLRFRKFRIVLSGKWFKLEGFINPWILLATGEIVWADKIVKKGKYGKEVVGQSKKTGELIEGILVRGSKTRPDYRHIADVFFKKTVSQANVIHHAIEQQVMKRFPKLFSLAEIHGGKNLRTILRGAFNSEVHLSKIRKLWNAFYTALEGRKVSAEVARRAFDLYSKSVDDFILAMDKFMRESPDVAKALAKNDKALVRELLNKETMRLLNTSAPDPKALIAQAMTELQ